MSEVPRAHAAVVLAATHMCYMRRNRSGSECYEDLENEPRGQDSRSPGSHGLLQTGSHGDGGKRRLGRGESIISQKEKDDSGLRLTMVAIRLFQAVRVPSHTCLL